ncbi:MAG: hypothetical protein VYC34_10160 [Planctomycetota bacterium]|nr:hypothetical protein [Planctomycetota bacterium]
MEIIALIAGLFAQSIIGAAIGSLLAAIFLRIAARWMLKLDIPYGSAYVTMFLAYIAATVAGLIVAVPAGLLLGAANPDLFESSAGDALLLLLILPVGFLAQSAVIGRRLELPFGRACLLTLLTGVVAFLVLAVIYAVVIAVVFIAV